MRHVEALTYLDDHLNREAVAGRFESLSLEPIEALLSALGDPHLAYPVVHVTGTNGKGSVATMVSALLEAHGLTVGLYTSPHLDSVNERLRVDRRPATDPALGAAIGAVAAVEELAGVVPSYFEILTAAALWWFADEAVDVAVVEVGLLGTWDATNAVHADVAVVTNVGKDHTDGVGAWREAVATEKAGIIEETSTAVIAEPSTDLLPIFEQRSPAVLWHVGRDFAVIENLSAVGGRLVSVRSPHRSYEQVFVPLQGAHQGDNLATALATAEAFFGRALDDDLVADALASIELPARVEILGRQPLVVLDGAHNPPGAVALREALGELPVEGGRVFVIGMLEGRDPAEFLAALGVAPPDLVVCCQPSSERAVEATIVEQAALSRGAATELVHDVGTAVGRALAHVASDGVAVITGSLYTVGEARNHLGVGL